MFISYLHKTHGFIFVKLCLKRGNHFPLCVMRGFNEVKSIIIGLYFIDCLLCATHVLPRAHYLILTTLGSQHNPHFIDTTVA